MELVENGIADELVISNTLQDVEIPFASDIFDVLHLFYEEAYAR